MREGGGITKGGMVLHILTRTMSYDPARYLPKYLQDEEAAATPEGIEELNEINMKLADYLVSVSTKKKKWLKLTSNEPQFNYILK